MSGHAPCIPFWGCLLGGAGGLDVFCVYTTSSVCTETRPPLPMYHPPLCTLQPQSPEAYANLASALKDCGRHDEALGSYRAALRLRPDFPEAFANYAHSLQCVCEWADRPALFARCAVGWWWTVGRVRQLWLILRWPALPFLLAPQCISSSCAALPAPTLPPTPPSSHPCRLEGEVRRDMASGRLPSVQPFHAMAYPFPSDLALSIGAAYAAYCLAAARRMGLPRLVHPPPAPLAPGQRLRVAYVSSDFGNHPLSHLMGAVFGMHDRRCVGAVGRLGQRVLEWGLKMERSGECWQQCAPSSAGPATPCWPFPARFACHTQPNPPSSFQHHSKIEVFCYALTPPDGSEWRARIEAEAEHFVDVSAWSAGDVASRISADGIQVSGWVGGCILRVCWPGTPAMLRAVHLCMVSSWVGGWALGTGGIFVALHPFSLPSPLPSTSPLLPGGGQPQWLHQGGAQRGVCSGAGAGAGLLPGLSRHHRRPLPALAHPGQGMRA